MLLAHPGELIDSSDIGVFSDELRHLINLGLDGVECFYPSHSAIITQACLEICNEKNLLVTAGSDCHGVFGKTRVGEMNIPLNNVVLKGLLDDYR
jgi:3',5'-nucleoside bisphosphate phosphatase